MDLQEIERILNYKFRNRSLLINAISHPGFHYTKKKSEIFERLEFLGDRVLGLALTTILYKKLKKENEGNLAVRFAYLSSTESLIKVAIMHNMIQHFDLPRDTIQKHNSSIADIMESIFAAIYLDSNGIEGVIKVIEFLFKDLMLDKLSEIKDNKSKLQEYSQKNGLGLPVYAINSISGPQHDLDFLIKVSMSSELFACGTGKNKKEAEQNAAASLMDKIKCKNQK